MQQSSSFPSGVSPRRSSRSWPAQATRSWVGAASMAMDARMAGAIATVTTEKSHTSQGAWLNISKSGMSSALPLQFTARLWATVNAHVSSAGEISTPGRTKLASLGIDWRPPSNSAFVRVNSGTWFDAAQLLANRLAAFEGRATKCAVAGLVCVSDASFGGKNLPWHGVYGAYKTCKPCRILQRMHVIACNACNYM